MSTVRLVDANALLEAMRVIPWGSGWEHDQLKKVIEAAPTLQPAEGDAISRSALIADFENHGYCLAIRLIEKAPSLPVSALDGDVDRAEDVVPGIEWGVRSSHWNKTASLSSNDGIYLEFCDGPDYLITKDQCVDLLNGALRRGETINWPEGHPRNPKPKEPTLLEAAENYVKGRGFVDYADRLRDLQAAIEREKGGKE